MARFLYGFENDDFVNVYTLTLIITVCKSLEIFKWMHRNAKTKFKYQNAQFSLHQSKNNKQRFVPSSLQQDFTKMIRQTLLEFYVTMENCNFDTSFQAAILPSKQSKTKQSLNVF